jgi:UDP-3-O-acyl-N-acetylglucosamine deacetylase
VTFRDCAGDTTLNGVPVLSWRAVPGERSTVISCGDASLRTVEHLFAALASRDLRAGVEIQVDGDELPLLDGAAGEWLDALGSHGRSAPPLIAVAREAAIDVGRSRYTFRPSSGVHVGVQLESDDARLELGASWGGDAADFRARIAAARTFCFAHELDELARRGLASHVRPESVVVLGDTVLAAGRPFEPDEPARHKLLDLMGDLFLYGGPPRGQVIARRPGHAATHEAMRTALVQRVLVPVQETPQPG